MRPRVRASQSLCQSLARQSLAHKAAQTLAGQLVDSRFADGWRCNNQAYLDNSHLTLTTKSLKKEELNVTIKLILQFRFGHEQISLCTINAKMMVSGIKSKFFIEPLFFKSLTSLVCYASQLPAPDQGFSHTWMLTIALHTVPNARQYCDHCPIWDKYSYRF